MDGRALIVILDNTRVLLCLMANGRPKRKNSPYEEVKYSSSKERQWQDGNIASFGDEEMKIY